MENLRNQIASDAPVSELNKEFHFISLPTLNAVAAEIETISPNFALFLGMDARTMSDRNLMVMADKLFSKGLAYLCAWGMDCKRVEHLFDQVVIGNYFASGIEVTQDNVVRTTSHEDAVISEALWFFIYATVPARDYEITRKDWVIVSVGDDRGGETIRSEAIRMLRNTDV
jgi:hypothetical protein